VKNNLAAYVFISTNSGVAELGCLLLIKLRAIMNHRCDDLFVAVVSKISEANAIS
jgi:hypothetical protein